MLRRLLSALRHKSLPVKILVALSVLLLFLSFLQPAFAIEGRDQDSAADGGVLFFVGWLSLFSGNISAGIVWLANPLCFISLRLALQEKKSALFTALAATAAALSFCFVRSIMSDEAGHYSRIGSLQNGYWLWLSAVVVLSLGIVIDRFTNTKKKIIRQNTRDEPAVAGKTNLPEIIEISDFAKLSVDYRLMAIMKYGDSEPVNPDHYKYFEFAIISDPDINVKLAALKRIHLFKGHPNLLPMITAIRQQNQYRDLEPYFSMALHRLDIITLDELDKIINRQ